MWYDYLGIKIEVEIEMVHFILIFLNKCLVEFFFKQACVFFILKQTKQYIKKKIEKT